MSIRLIVELTLLFLIVVSTPALAVYVPVVLPSKHNDYLVENAFDKDRPDAYRNVYVLPPGVNISVKHPVNLAIDGNFIGVFNGGIINLSHGEHQIELGERRIDVSVINETEARGMQAPILGGFEFFAAFIVIAIIFAIRRYRTGG